MKTNLAITYPPSAWSLFSWRRFADMPDKDKRVAIIPVVSFSNWGRGISLDTEESLAMGLLNGALAGMPDPTQFLVTPPMRFNLGSRAKVFFRTDVETAHQVLAEVAGSVQAAGFRKILFLNSNPDNEHLVDAAGRDLRIALGLQPFCINLSSVGLEWSSEKGKEHCLQQVRLLKEDSTEGLDPLKEILGRLRGLLKEVHSFRPLPDNGRIPNKSQA